MGVEADGWVKGLNCVWGLLFFGGRGLGSLTRTPLPALNTPTQSCGVAVESSWSRRRADFLSVHLV